jgi:hypothetical protein
MPLKVVTLKEIEQIFTVIDRIGIHREAVVIPLKPATPGSVRRLPNGKYEILVEGERPVEDWLPDLEKRLLELQSGAA